MAKEITRKTEVIPESVQVVLEEKITCDKCGRQIYEDPPEDDEDAWSQTLEIYANADQCVSDRVRMDLCVPCIKPIWVKICEAIGADPEEELRIGQD